MRCAASFAMRIDPAESAVMIAAGLLSINTFPQALSKVAAVVTFVGFNITFLPQFVLGYLGMPRRYHAYPPEFQVLNVLSTACATILAIGYMMPLLHLAWSLKY